MKEYFLKLENINKTYGKGELAVTALSSVYLYIRKGETAVVAGPSGSGKTTLLNLTGGLDIADSGTISIGGIELDRMNEKQLTSFRREKIGLVFQEDSLIPEMTVYENIELPLALLRIENKKRKYRIERILSSLGMTDKKKRFPYELSGGEKQRISIARAVIHSPSLVLADEPTANLDMLSSTQVIDTIKNISDSLNITFILTTHDGNVLSRFEKIIKLNYGRIV